jgi:sugar lactone lactonase YvrE
VTAAEPVTVAGGLGFAESPRWREGRLWFSDQALRAVFTLEGDGTVSRHFGVPSRPSGLGWRADGTLLVVSMEDRTLRSYRDGQLALVADLSAFATWHCNDMLVDAQGRAYIGNFGFNFGGGGAVRPATLVRVDPDGSVVAAATDLLFPNGMALSPDGRALMVAETYGSRLTAFDVAGDGSLSGQRTFAQLEGVFPDGICLDAEGAVWVSSARSGEVIRVLDGGAVTDRIPTGRRGAFACMLGGDDRRTLFICCADGSDWARCERDRSGEIRRLGVDVPGAGLP